MMQSLAMRRVCKQGAGERRAQPLEYQRVLALESGIPTLLVLPLSLASFLASSLASACACCPVCPRLAQHVRKCMFASTRGVGKAAASHGLLGAAIEAASVAEARSKGLHQRPGEEASWLLALLPLLRAQLVQECNASPG